MQRGYKKLPDIRNLSELSTEPIERKFQILLFKGMSSKF